MSEHPQADRDGACTPLELDAVLLSRLIHDGDRMFLGANLQAPRLGALLARSTHAPGLRLAQALAWLDPPPNVVPEPVRGGVDLRDTRYAEALIHDDEVFDDVVRLASVFVLGGLQIDAFGNTNMAGQLEDGVWVRRGPGPIGTTTMATIVPRKILYTLKHDPSVLVERCAVTTALGWRAPSGAMRHSLGIPTDGPALCITPMAVFDFPPPARRMRLTRLRAGSTVASVRSSTGFDFEVDPDLGTVEEPTREELHALRRITRGE